MIYSPSLSDSSGSDTFPALIDSIYEYKKAKTKESVEKIKKSLSVITYSIQSAISIIKDPADFSRTV